MEGIRKQEPGSRNKESRRKTQDVRRKTKDLRRGTFRNCYIPEVNSKFKSVLFILNFSLRWRLVRVPLYTYTPLRMCG